jgi:putative membrane protein
MSMTLISLLVWSGFHAHDRPTWFLETLPVMLVLTVLWLSYRRFPLTPLLYGLIFAHAIVLIVGGMYTYARVPLGFELQEWLGLSRNPYDKIGHFFQGFVPAITAREILIRGQFVNGNRMRVFLIVCIVLAISATYELLEWLVADVFGDGAVDFLGTQGDVWDAQSDMLFAVIGAAVALMTLSRWHDRQLGRFPEKRE